MISPDGVPSEATEALRRLTVLERATTSRTTLTKLAHVSKIYPKTRSVAFAGKNMFSDNNKYAFLDFQARAQNAGVVCHYITEDVRQHELLIAAGLPGTLFSDRNPNPEIFRQLLATKILVLTDNFYPQPGQSAVAHALLQGAQQIQLWHGIPLKEIGLQNLSSIESLAACGPFAAMVGSSAASEGDWAQRFAFGEFAALGHPRNDVFFRTPSPHDLINVDLESLNAMQASQQAGQPVVLYAPTFRDHSGPDWILKSGIADFATHCRAQGYAFYINLHPSEQHAIGGLRTHFADAQFIAAHSDDYPLIRHVDILITDYSSLAFDYLLLDRPILFFRPDHADYVVKSRPLIKGREHYSPGPLAFTIAGLIANLEAVVAERQAQVDTYREVRQTLRRKLFDHCDDNASRRVSDLILKHIDAAT